MTPIRPSFFSGLLYPADAGELRSTLLSFLGTPIPRKKAKAITVPHGNTALVGKKMAEIYASIEIPNHVILLGQNHTERGEKFAIYSRGAWQTPLGEVKINEELAVLWMENTPSLRHDELAFFQDPTLEVQLPFLQVLSPKTQIVPLTVMPTTQERCQSLGQGLAKTVQQYPEPILIIISANTDPSDLPCGDTPISILSCALKAVDL
ncbi:MAG: AmmeMemoRadiSam system protein B [Deltaproteobacteria bacterium]|nr:AmmeMemoRadiSam system protein B [Deltaproteobacteria bacterium]